MSWTSVSKPTSSTFTAINTQGKEQYDQASIEYDDSSIYYDGVYATAWTGVVKPTGGALTWDEAIGAWDSYSVNWNSMFGGDQFTRVNKPS